MHRASRIVRGRFSTFKRSDVQTFKRFHPPTRQSSILPLFHRRIVPRKNIFRIFLLKNPASVPGLPSPVCVSNCPPSMVNGPSSTFNLQPSTFNRLHLILEKEIQKNKPKSNLEPLHIRHHLIIPPHIRLSRVTQPELNDIYIELFRNN
jgi:hypothetical protein